MAYASHADTQVTSNIWTNVTGFFATVGRAMIVASTGEARLRQAEFLNAKTDAELAEMGLRREDIAGFVFRDLMHI